MFILDIAEYHFLAGSFKYRSLTFTSKDRQKQLQHVEGISVCILCGGSTESQNSALQLRQKVGRLGPPCKMNVSVSRVLKGFPKMFTKDEKTIKYTQSQMKQNSFFSDDSKGPSGFCEALGQVVLETGGSSDSWPCPKRGCFKLNPDHSLLISGFFLRKREHKKRNV